VGVSGFDGNVSCVIVFFVSDFGCSGDRGGGCAGGRVDGVVGGGG